MGLSARHCSFCTDLDVVRYNIVIPVVYALLPNKTRASYVKLLQELKRIQVGLQPMQLMTDFEHAAMQAFQQEFPETNRSGCFFHLTQSVWRKVQEQGLKARTDIFQSVRYEQDYQFARWVRMIPALAFLRPENVSDAFEDLNRRRRISRRYHCN
ncbi:hypothetical protein PPYR_06260, partial [Photinus pyralis]